MLRRHTRNPEIITHKDANHHNFCRVRGEKASWIQLVAVAVVRGRLHGLVHLLLAWDGAQTIEAEAVEFVLLRERAIVECGILHVGAYVSACGEACAVGEGQVVEDFSECAP